MLDLGKVAPGSTIYIPSHYFDSNDPSASSTASGFALADVKVYKNGGTTQRASTSGFSLLDTDGIDFDGITGINGLSIDLSDDTTSGFYTAGASYWVVYSTVTVDGATISHVAATFRIGYDGAIHETTIATLASQTSFTLTDGSSDNTTYFYCSVVIHKAGSALQFCRGWVSAYTGSTKTITLKNDPNIFTIAAGDDISFFPVIGISSQVSNGVASSIVTYGLDHIFAASVTGTDVANNSFAAKLVSASATADWDDYDNTTDSLQANRDWIGDGTNLTEAGGTGDHLTAINLPDQTMNITGDITGNLSGSVGSVTGAINTAAGTITTLDGLDTAQDTQHSTTQSAISALNDPTAAAIADQVWDEATSGHSTAGTTGKALTDILADTNELQSDDIPGTLAALNDVSVADILTTQMTESYAADGTAPTIAQALHMIQQMLGEFAVSGTTLTVKKLDGSTQAATFTLDDATSPTSITRAS